MKNYKNKICMFIGFIAQIIFILISILMMCKEMSYGSAIFLTLIFLGWILPVIGACIDKAD